MLSILRSNQPIANLVAPLIALLGIGLHVFLSPVTIELNESHAWLPGSLTWHGFPWVNMVFALATAMLLNRCFLRHELNRSGNVLAAFFFIFPAMVIPHTLPYSPVFPGAIFFVLGVNETLKIYRQNDGAASYFNAGFLFGVATVICGYFASAELMLIVAVLYTRAANWREIMLPIVGFILPFMIFATLLWLLDMPLNSFWFGLTDPGSADISWTLFVFASLMALLSVTGLLFMLGTFSSSSNKSKNSKAVLLFFSVGILGSAITAYFHSEAVASNLLLIPAAWSLPWLFLERQYRLQGVLFYTLILAGILSWIWVHFGWLS
ncbi:DUF6427 family protein [Sanyastnella coralliicola]|uniref:DUF6427 family protein n=1 Tax=Sanyastnella coralliicola TaxID=3069118 RepID=UPI0027B8E15A|nr:DUF6427 family protein [Longitalea sp. SCSIO 12813]